MTTLIFRQMQDCQMMSKIKIKSLKFQYLQFLYLLFIDNQKQQIHESQFPGFIVPNPTNPKFNEADVMNPEQIIMMKHIFTSAYSFLQNQQICSCQYHKIFDQESEQSIKITCQILAKLSIHIKASVQLLKNSQQQQQYMQNYVFPLPFQQQSLQFSQLMMQFGQLQNATIQSPNQMFQFPSQFMGPDQNFPHKQ